MYQEKKGNIPSFKKRDIQNKKLKLNLKETNNEKEATVCIRKYSISCVYLL
jgi:hypothetical protein